MRGWRTAPQAALRRYARCAARHFIRHSFVGAKLRRGFDQIVGPGLFLPPPNALRKRGCGFSKVATSVVYTPSECMKQRMQVQAHTSTWSALKAILKADGPAGLYRGWTAVLARNIPQSAIKFFTFEQLKWLLLSGGAAGVAAGDLRCACERARTPVDRKLQGRRCRLSGGTDGARQAAAHAHCLSPLSPPMSVF
jgi:hypothetical protein